MTDDLRKFVDSFVKQMEGVNEKRCEAAHKELQFCMTESRLFNELRQNLLEHDRTHLTLQVKDCTAKLKGEQELCVVSE